ncbi:MAG: lipoyl(octanoyl) transferase LipB [Bacteroidales bacterium]|jgi:lipoyl(octanoyl) transferase|nr:lipoyl(octanoyl) transferase LipB [Bacteroidales bacterium]
MNKNTKIQYVDWGMVDYAQAFEQQKAIFDKKVAQKANFQPLTDDTEQLFIVCQHPHVYTLGKNGNAGNMLINSDFLHKIGATFHHIDRGGDITYHGPGQIVGYPILDLEVLQLSLKGYIFALEEAVIKTLQLYGIQGHRLSGATGVWLSPNTADARKICAIGVKASRFVTMHGFAFNANTDLKYFTYINPCGFVDKGVTTLAKELNHPVDTAQIQTQIYKHFVEICLGRV